MTLSDWVETPLGKRLVSTELTHARHFFKRVVGDVAIQFGLPTVPYLGAGRIRTNWLYEYNQFSQSCNICGSEALPFASSAIDFIVLPHVLEFLQYPAPFLQEIERIIRPGGSLAIIGFNPYSVWGFLRVAKHVIRKGSIPYPWCGEFFPLLLVHAWLQFLGFEMTYGAYMHYRLPLSCRFMNWSCLEVAGDRWWPSGAAVYMVMAVKRVVGMRVVGPLQRKKKEARGVWVPVG